MSSPFKVMLACEVTVLPRDLKPPKSSGIHQSVSHRTRSFTPRSHTLQHEKGPLVYVSGPEAITPKYLILYSKAKPSATQPTVTDGRTTISV